MKALRIAVVTCITGTIVGFLLVRQFVFLPAQTNSQLHAVAFDLREREDLETAPLHLLSAVGNKYDVKIESDKAGTGWRAFQASCRQGSYWLLIYKIDGSTLAERMVAVGGRGESLAALRERTLGDDGEPT